jgi:hypothetical protein
MTKKIIIILYLVSNFIFAQKNDIALLDLKSNVKEIKYLTNEYLIKSIKFNKAGFITEHKEYSQNKLTYLAKRNYDQNGNKTSSGDDIITTYYKYDELGNITENTELQTINKDTLRITKNKFTGRNIEKMEFYEFTQKKKSLTQKTIYEYDSSNNLIKEIRYVGSQMNSIKDTSPITYFYFYSYDKSNNLVEKVAKDEKGNVSSIYTYKYDSKNNKIEDRCQINHNSASGYETYIYDEKNNLIEFSKYNIDNELLYKDEYRFDKNNNLLARTHYFKNEKTSIIEYKYDSKKNRIEEKNYIKGKLQDITTRVFDNFGNVLNMRMIDNNGKVIVISKQEILYY